MLNLRNLIEVLQETKKKKKTAKYIPNQVNSIKKKIQIYQYILIQIQEKTNLELATTIQMMALPWHLFIDLGTSFSVLSIW